MELVAGFFFKGSGKNNTKIICSITEPFNEKDTLLYH